MLNHRENMLRAYRRNKPEFIPLELPLSPKMGQMFREKTGSDKTIEEYFGISSRWISPVSTKEKQAFRRYFLDLNLPEDAQITEWGEALIMKEEVEDCIHIAPLRGAKSVKEIEEFPFPAVEDYDWMDYAKRVGETKKDGFCVHGGGISFFESCWSVRGFENLLTDMINNKEFAHSLFSIITEVMEKLTIKSVEAGVDVFFTGSDVATQNGLLMSKPLWHEFVKPMMKTLFSTAKKINPDVLIFYHSCGKIEELIPDLMETGIEVLNPIQPECNDIFQIKRKYGRLLSFFGGIGVQTTLPFGSPKEVKDTVRKTIREMGEGGGYVCAPAHIIRQEVPWENVLAFVEAVKEYGKY
ncbi:MAG: hypothetical protein HY350_00240 [Candidatus Omnitrophica bacterium]|nr:hypothetical protein [Candidatus Omnitrophota bacterium]